nr:reverse transcriptase domain-containing protein [Tanacetum cinerariifolium]
IRRWRYNLIPAESKFKNLVLDHQDKYMMKAQVHVSKSSAISGEQTLPQKKRYCQIYQMINFTGGVKWFDELFHEAWDTYKDLLPDQDSLNAAAGGNLLERRTQDVLTIIENKSKCLTTGGNTFPELQDNIQGYVSAAAINYNEGNSVYRPPGSGSLPRNIVVNPKGKLKAITTRSGLVLDGPTIPTPPPFINSEEDERVEETLTNPDLSEYTIKVPPPFIQKYKHSSQKEYVVHQRDPLHSNIPYPSRMLKQKQQEKDEVQIHKFWQMFKQLHINITLTDALILMPTYQKMLKSLLSNKEKLQELANTPLNENCSVVILKKLPKKLGDPGKFLILCGFSELKCKALTDFSEDFLEDLFSNQPSGNPTFSSHPELTSPEVQDDIFDSEGGNVLPEKLLDLDYTKDLHPPLHDNPLNLQFDVESDLKEIEFILHKDIDSNLKDSIDQSNLANPADNFVDSMPEMFTDEHALDYSSPLIFDEYDDFLEDESDTENVYDDPFDSKKGKIKESKLLIDELDRPCVFVPSESDSFIS